MNLKEFAEYVKEHILDGREDLKDCTVTIEECIKTNDSKYSYISIMDGPGKMCPVINLEPHFEEYEKGRSLEDCIQDMLDIYDYFHSDEVACMDQIDDFEIARERLMVKVINHSRNKELLEGKPYFVFGDLAVIFLIRFETSTFGVSTTTVTNSLVKAWEISLEELLEIALYNMQTLDPAKIISISALHKIVQRAVFEVEDMPEEIDDGMYVMTSSSQFNGASTILRLDLLQTFADKANKNVYVLPSSIHEVMLLPDDGNINPVELRRLVRDVNRTEVSREEYLSDNVYYYDRNRHQITIAGKSEPMILTEMEDELCC